MHDDAPPVIANLSRRQLIAGLGAASGAAGLLAALPGGTIVAGPAEPAIGPGPAQFPQVLAPVVPALTYAQLDAYAFFNEDTSQGRQVDQLTGATAINTFDLVAPLPVPSRSRIRQINVSYRGTPVVAVFRREFANPLGDQIAFITGSALPDSGPSPRAETVTTDVPLLDNVTYTLRVFGPAGTSLHGATVGYVPPTQGFVPVDPPTRPFDTRQASQGPKLAPGVPRTVNLGLPAGARGAVLNLTITNTETSFGYVSIYRNGIDWPGNSSINWSSPGLTAANAVITAVDSQGRIAVRAGEAATDAIIDVVGYLA